MFQPDRLRDPATFETIAALKPDLGVVVAYGKLIPEPILALPRFGMINVHASLLPKYRGAAPVHRAVIDGEPQTGITIMQVVKALDAGDMLAKVARPIGPDETSDVVERDLAGMGARLLLEVIGRLEAGTITAEPQDHSRSTYAPRLTKEEGLIDWTLPAVAVHNRVRGLYPWPHAYSYLDGARLILLRTHVAGAAPGHVPGEVVDVNQKAIAVAAGDGRVVAIEELQPEGKRPMRAREFLAGRVVQPGARFSGP